MKSPSRSRVKFESLVLELGEERADGLADAQKDCRESPFEIVFRQRIGDFWDEFLGGRNRYG